jgi:hypothetical protein
VWIHWATKDTLIPASSRVWIYTIFFLFSFFKIMIEIISLRKHLRAKC